MSSKKIDWRRALLGLAAAIPLLTGCPEDRRPATEASPIPSSAEGAGAPAGGGQTPAGAGASQPAAAPDAGVPDGGVPGPK